MITDAILSALGGVLSALISLLPVGELDLPAVDSFASMVAEYAGPWNRYTPAYEVALGLTIVVLVWAPAMLVYQLTFWSYKHLPVIGAG